MAKVAFIGLGVMGFPMAGHLARAGHAVTVFNRTSHKIDTWLDRFGGTRAHSPAAAARNAEIVFTCVGNDDDLRDVVSGPEGLKHGLAAGSICIDHSTTSADVARETAERLAAQRTAFLDAPVSGGQSGAENGTLTVMVGGDAAAFTHAEPVMAAYAKRVRRVGEVGAGQLTKMVNQICIAGLVQGLSEGLAFGTRAGLPMDDVLDVIGKGAAQSWQMDNRARTMLRGEFDFGFAVDLMRKDLGIVLSEARRNGAQLPVTALVDQFYATLQRNGDRRLDTSSLIKLLQGS